VTKEHHRTPTVSQIEPTEFRGGETGNLKGNLLMEYALQTQKNNLYNTKQIVGEFQALIFEKFSNLSSKNQPLNPSCRVNKYGTTIDGTNRY